MGRRLQSIHPSIYEYLSSYLQTKELKSHPTINFKCALISTCVDSRVCRLSVPFFTAKIGRKKAPKKGRINACLICLTKFFRLDFLPVKNDFGNVAEILWRGWRVPAHNKFGWAVGSIKSILGCLNFFLCSVSTMIPHDDDDIVDFSFLLILLELLSEECNEVELELLQLLDEMAKKEGSGSWWDRSKPRKYTSQSCWSHLPSLPSKS